MSAKRIAVRTGRPVKVPGDKGTKEKILDAAIDLFSEKGYESVSMRDIARAVGVSETAVYRHFEGKEHLMDSIIGSLIAEFQPGPGATPVEALLEQYGPEGFVDRAARATMERMKEARIRKISRLICIELYRNEKVRDFFKYTFIEPSYQSWEHIFRTMMDQGYIGECDPRQVAIEIANYAVYLYIDGFIIRYGDGSYESLVDSMMDDFSRHIRFVFKTVRVYDAPPKRKKSKKRGD